MLIQPGFDPQCVTMTIGLVGYCLATNVFCLPQMGQVSPETAVMLLMLSSYSGLYGWSHVTLWSKPFPSWLQLWLQYECKL